MSSSESEGEKEKIRTRRQQRIVAAAKLVDDQQREERRTAAVRAAELRARSNLGGLKPSKEKSTLTPEEIQVAEAQRVECFNYRRREESPLLDCKDSGKSKAGEIQKGLAEK